ncbi:MAG: PAS domain S-box protein, partial [Proteobacteria bacterium]|nr:PAS domain S-box protein [Pseudomonadota bacterium]
MPGQTQDDLRVLHWRARTVVTRITQAVLIGVLAVIATGDWLAAPWVAAAAVTILLDAQIARRQLASGGGLNAHLCAALALSATVYACIGLVLIRSGGWMGVAEAALVNCAVMLNATLMSRGVRRATVILTAPPSVFLLCLPVIARLMGHPVALRDTVPMMVGAFSFCVFVVLMAKTFLTESRALEAALAAKEDDRQWLRQGIEAMTEGVALFDAADRLLIWNHTFEALAPRAGPLPVTGLHAQDLLAAVTGGEALAEHWFSGAAMNTQLQTAAGRWLNIEFRPMANQGRMVVLADITDLKARELSFRILFDDNPLPMLVIDRESLEIVDVNAAAVRAFGWPREAMMSLAVTEFLIPGGRDRATEQLAEIVALNNPAPMSLVDGFGRAREILPYVQPTVYQGRAALLAAVLDVTERRQAMQAVETARDAAEAANRAKSDFLATVSHEIRTPLNGVLGMAQAMARDTLPDRQRERLEVISQSGETLLAILNDILDLSKIEAGKLELEDGEFDLAELALGAHGAFTGAANGKGLSFNLEVDERARGIYRGDSVRVRQILYNLISNAVKFTA